MISIVEQCSNVVSIRPTEYTDMKSSPQEPRNVGCGGSELTASQIYFSMQVESGEAIDVSIVKMFFWQAGANAVEDCIDNNWTW